MIGFKDINIQTSITYPVISAFEFEQIKSIPQIQDIWRESTIYMIVQRPLMYFNRLTINDGIIHFEISDHSGNEPLVGSFDPTRDYLTEKSKGFSFIFESYVGKENSKSKLSPADFVAGFRIESESREHLIWYTPQKIIHQFLNSDSAFYLSGEINNYIDYKVHYIGQAFDQDVWKRLTGHEKFQSILIAENPLNKLHYSNSYDIGLVLLEVQGFTEITYINNGRYLKPDIEPIGHSLKELPDLHSFHEAWSSYDSPELTNEVEALLINEFSPDYNKVKFLNYPNIKSGTRSKGYSSSTLTIERSSVILKTDKYKLDPVW